MTREVLVEMEALDAARFAPYGSVILAPAGRPADVSGAGWECWLPLGAVSGAPQVGLVRSQPGPLRAAAMERHPDRPEWIFAVERPIVQLVALSDADAPDRPAVGSARAFVIQPGQGVQVERGVWHAPAMPAGAEPVHYLFLLGPQPEDVPAEGWVRFAQDEQILAYKG